LILQAFPKSEEARGLQHVDHAHDVDLFDPKYHDGKTGCVFAETVVITKTGARRMHDYSMDFQTIAV
jgi:hypothetical protein